MTLQAVKELNINKNIAVAIYPTHLDAELAIRVLAKMAGPLFTALVSGVEDVAVMGGMGVLGVALVSLGVPKHRASVYQTESRGGQVRSYRSWNTAGNCESQIPPATDQS